MSTKTKHKTNLIKLVFGLALLFFIVWKLWHEPFLETLESIALIENYSFYFLIFILLMLVNWSFETLKWQILMKEIKPLNFKVAFLSVLAGISTGLLTPNRIGNFIGRTVYLDEKIKSKATLFTFMGNMGQFTATLIMGLIGFEVFGRTQLLVNPLAIELIALFLILLCLYLYLYPKFFKIFRRIIGDVICEGIDFVQNFNLSKKTQVLFLSLLRYVVFLSQYWLLFYIFQVEIDPLILLSAISIVFLITTIIPSFLFGKLFVREASALFVFTEMGISTPVILLTVFILWFINLALPAFVGAFVLIRK